MSSSRRIAMKMEYDGEKFSGSQMQIGVRTVQEDFEKAVNTFFRTGEERAIKATFSGRTDSGVHAVGQVVHFDLSDEFLLRTFTVVNSNGTNVCAPSTGGPGGGDSNACAEQTPNLINRVERNITLATDGQPILDDEVLRKICWGLNGILKKDMSLVQAQVVDDKFNSRFTAVKRTYVYRILNRAQRTALRHTMQHFVPFPLDVESMERATADLLGRHDFNAFKSSYADNSHRQSTICLISRAELLKKGESELEFWISADHFVYNMVRIIVGTLLDVGLGKRDPSAIADALAGKKRHLAGPTAPPWGLCLFSVEYPAEYSLFQRDSAESLVSQEK